MSPRLLVSNATGGIVARPRARGSASSTHLRIDVYRHVRRLCPLVGLTHQDRRMPRLHRRLNESTAYMDDDHPRLEVGMIIHHPRLCLWVPKASLKWSSPLAANRQTC